MRYANEKIKEKRGGGGGDHPDRDPVVEMDQTVELIQQPNEKWWKLRKGPTSNFLLLIIEK